MSDIMTDESLESRTLVEDNVKRFAVNLLELASAYEDSRIQLESQHEVKGNEIFSSPQEYCREQQNDQKDDTEPREPTCVKEQSQMEQKPENTSPAEKTEDETYLLTQHMQKLKLELEVATRQFFQAAKSSSAIKDMLKQLMQVAPQNSAYLTELDLPISVSHFDEAVPKVSLSKKTTEKRRGKLIGYLLRFRSSLFTEMLTTPEDRKRKDKYLKEIKNHLQENENKIKQSSMELEEIIAKNKVEIEKTMVRMNEQREQIDSLNNYMTGRVNRIQQEEEQKKEVIRNNSKGGLLCYWLARNSVSLDRPHNEAQPRMRMSPMLAQQMELKQQLTDRKHAYKKTVEINRAEELSQRATIFKVETELESMINKYDQEMTALQTEYDTLDEEYTREKKELNELEERFLTLEEEYLEILEERRLQEEKRRREEEARRALEQAVTTIQAFWRSYKTRKMVRGRRGAGRKGT
ncbi:hypothetical protein PHET_06214 [Paragonimus heterotremus]|uniref:Dynein regulatory complex protein 10 n=1 Tax=Paragonimus heterotremus TaxID=100268 RepID=A0A8J4TBY8_9TREM|nr:hypothetical protein PHET_06214 [Paragonimus heterotremus]